MALSKKLVKAVKDAQKQAEATLAEVRGAVDGRLSDVNVDPTPFYAVVGAANIAVDTIRSAAEQLEAARKQTKSGDLRKGARKEAAELQKDLQKRVADLQSRTAELQHVASQFADRFVAQAQDLPAQVLNQGLVMAGNAKDQYEAAAARGAKVVGDLRSHGGQSLEEATDAAREEAASIAARVEDLAGTAGDLAGAAGEAVAPEKPARPSRSAVKKSSDDKASTAKSSAKKSTTQQAATQKTEKAPATPAKKAAKKSTTKSPSKATTSKANS